jgi:hypothetical protein
VEALEPYDIDYYVSLGELTLQQVQGVIRACLRSSLDMVKLEDANAALTLQNSELERLNEFRKGVLHRLGNPDEGYIAQVLSQSQALLATPGLPASVRARAETLVNTATEIRHIFEPYEFEARAEQALHGKSILIVESKPKARRLATRALLGSGARVEALEDPGQAAARLEQGGIDILYVDWDNVAVITTATAKNPGIHCLLVTDIPIFEQCGSQIMALPLSNLIITSMATRADLHDPTAVHELVVTAGKILSGDVFGLEKYLAWGTAIREEVVPTSRARVGTLDRIGELAQRAGLRGTLCNNLQTLADELLMNAIWDAPIDANGAPKYARLARAAPLELLPEERPLIRYGFDGNVFGVSVSDPFGRLEGELAFRYLVKCFSRGADQVNHAEGGAGLGLYMAYLAASTLVINVDAGHRTEVIGLLNLNLAPRDLRGRSRSFQYFRTVAAV